MSEFLSNLEKDIYPPIMVDHFVRWCVWEQARPALVEILSLTGCGEWADEIREITTYADLEKLSEQAGQYAHEIGSRTGPLGISTAEASAFLMQKLAHAAQEKDWDPEGVSFFAMQIVSWKGFAETMFTDMKKKLEAAETAKTEQEQKLSDLWGRYGQSSSDE